MAPASSSFAADQFSSAALERSPLEKGGPGVNRDGRIRTDDLSVPNAGYPLQHVLAWTNTQLVIGGETRGDGHGWLRTRDKRGMELWPYKSWSLGDHPFLFSAMAKPNGASRYKINRGSFCTRGGAHNAGYGRCEPTRRVVGCVGFRFRLHLNGGHVEKVVGFGFGDFVGDGASRIGSLGGTACHGGCLPFQLSG